MHGSSMRSDDNASLAASHSKCATQQCQMSSLFVHLCIEMTVQKHTNPFKVRINADVGFLICKGLASAHSRMMSFNLFDSCCYQYWVYLQRFGIVNRTTFISFEDLSI